MGTDERIKKILDSWRGANRLKEDTWQNVSKVLDYYGFTYERTKEYVCRHDILSSFAVDPRARELLRSLGLGLLGEISIAVTHGSKHKSGMVIQHYLKMILNAIELIEVIERRNNI